MSPFTAAVQAEAGDEETFGPGAILHSDLAHLAVDASGVPFVQLQAAWDRAEELRHLPPGPVREDETARLAERVREARMEPPSIEQLQRAVARRLKAFADDEGVAPSGVSLRPEHLVRSPSLEVSVKEAERAGRRSRDPAFRHDNSLRLASRIAGAATAVLDAVTDYVLLEADAALSDLAAATDHQQAGGPVLTRVRSAVLRIAGAPGSVRTAMQDGILDVLSPATPSRLVDTMPSTAPSQRERVLEVRAAAFGQVEVPSHRPSRRASRSARAGDGRAAPVDGRSAVKESRQASDGKRSGVKPARRKASGTEAPAEGSKTASSKRAKSTSSAPEVAGVEEESTAERGFSSGGEKRAAPRQDRSATKEKRRSGSDPRSDEKRKKSSSKRSRKNRDKDRRARRAG